MDVLDIFGIIYVVLNYFIVAPFSIYAFRKCNKLCAKNEYALLRFRDTKLIRILHGLVLVLLLIDRPLHLLHRVWRLLSPSTLWLLQILSVSVLGGLFVFFSVKVYHLYFQYKYNMEISDISWRKDINPNDTMNWYISHKHSFGNSTFLIKLVSIPLLLVISIEIIQYMTMGEGVVFVLFHALLVVASLLVSITTYWKVRELEDVYNIKHEIFYQFIFLMLGLLLYICINLLTKNDRLKWLLVIYVTSYCFALPLSLSSVLYPLYLIKQKNSKQPLNSSSNIEPTVVGLSGLKVVISDYKLLRLFMKHCVSEFCCESLLFIVELLQIKIAFQVKQNNIIRIKRNEKYVFIDFNKNTDYNNDYTLILLNDENDMTVQFDCKQPAELEGIKLYLTSNLPKTIILEKDNLRDQMIDLFDKYIADSCDHQLNIPFHIKHKLIIFFEETIGKLPKQQYFELFNIFDECYIETLSLINDPFQRFIWNKNIMHTITKLQNKNNHKNNNNNIDVTYCD